MNYLFSAHVAVMLCACFALRAQLNPELLQLAPLIQSDVFLPNSNNLPMAIPDGSSFTDSYPETVRSLFFKLNKAEYASNNIPSAQMLRQSAKARKSLDTVIPIHLAAGVYDDLVANAFGLGLLAMIEDQFIDISGPLESPVYQEEFFAIYLDFDRYTEGTYLFQLSSDFFFTELGVMSDVMIDFDDGLGFQPLEPNQVREVSYESQDVDRHIRFKATINEQEYRSGMKVRSAGGESAIPLPNLPPWEPENPIFPWRVQVEYEDTNVYANAYTLTSEDNQFDRPFIFVEGIDFGFDASVLRNGTFGWYEFSSGQSTEYPFLYNSPEMINTLRDAGYDIILVDFFDGAADILANAEVLKAIIQLTNEHKVSQNELVVAGASMGGQVSRIALRQMELEGIPHCTRSWISLDSPHKGAHIPRSLREAIFFLEEHVEEADNFADNFLRRPAARQMLLDQYPEVGEQAYLNMQNYLTEIGYPEQVRKIGMANGNIHGIELGIEPQEHLVDYNCTPVDYNILKFLLIASPGDPYNVESNEFENTIAIIRYSVYYSCQGWDCFQWDWPISWATHEHIARVPNNYLNYDNAPGGKRTSIKDFAESINASLQSYPTLETWCDLNVGDYEDHHSFISTLSALGIPGNDYYMDVQAEIDAGNITTPFDRIYGHPTGNMTHSEINNDMLQIMIEEVLQGESSIPSVLSENTPEGSEFNLAHPSQNVVYTHEVSDGGVLHVNGNLPINFGDDETLFPEDGSHMNCRTSQCGGSLLIGNQGSFFLGSEGGNLTANFTVTSGSTFEMEQGAFVVIHENSELVIQSGASCIIHGGNLQLRNGASILIEEGADLIIYGDEPIQLEGIEATIDIYGRMHVGDNATATFHGFGSEGGKLRFFSSGINILGGLNSQLEVIGTGLNDKMIELVEGGNLWTSPDFGKIEVRDASITFGTDSKLTAGGGFRATGCKLLGLDTNYGLRVYGDGRLKDCLVSTIPIRCHPGNASFRVDDSHLTWVEMQVIGGSYKCFDSQFYKSTIDSESLSHPVTIIGTFFEEQGEHSVALYDDSDVAMLLKDSGISGYDIGLDKSGGAVTIRCSDFTENEVGIRMGLYSELNMSTSFGGGYNYFDQNGVHCELNGVLNFEVDGGYNQFLSAEEHMFEGSILGFCDESCQRLFPVHQNTWFNGVPTSSDAILRMVDPECDDLTPFIPLDGCVLKLIDKSPQLPVSCGAMDEHGDHLSALGKSFNQEPLIQSDHFDNIPLSSAITRAIWEDQYLQSDADPHLKALMLHEILYTDLDANDASIRRIMRRASSALQEVRGELALRGQLVFDPDSAQTFDEENDLAVKTLNKITGQSTPIEQYFTQAAYELEKSQLLFSLGLFDQSIEVLEQMEHCGLDYWEQEAVNHRKSRILEYTHLEESLNQYFDNDSVLLSSPDISLIEPQEFDPTQAVFDAEILSPDDIQYPLCGEIGQRAERISSNNFLLYPNPGEAIIFVRIDDSEESFELRIIDSSGRCVLRQATLSDQPVTIDHLAKGIYVVEIESLHHSARETLVVH
ncbi:T9SS type A sorting domain-containing protein [Sanyastnella coralliicola]|uniref:T9SS type A sorting domain-containing protein n=1 Tax=Sanyastnella coralliicola TaxID=3069118 RepID=UPI0027BA0B9B|nr:T9SS type A sorting domain-containing protein [Longitalea sp. SCSIO 12813]